MMIGGFALISMPSTLELEERPQGYRCWASGLSIKLSIFLLFVFPFVPTT